ncbi:BAR/IMD domain-containing adapter protein 2-like [Watersipora subatra]|uniref:BAR/IMD domain-containing adapter protein 2-like n=1 Tax=Watersipora subatra TaxID=2589382 RepID=UPI00355B0074
MDTTEVDKSEKAHEITTAVYKDLQTNFTQGLKAIWTTGKALHKSLEVSAQKAKAHFDAITLLGQAASQSEGTVITIGHALMQMAEIYKEIQHQADDNIAALKKELCNPLEFILLDNSEKMEEKLKKYSKEHSKAVVHYKKAAANLAKHRKKSKGSQNNKEMQYYREATEAKQKLDKLRLKHLKDALFEEKTCYLYAFEKLVAVTKNASLHSQRSEELLENRLADWEVLTQSKDMSKDALKLIESISAQTDNNNEGTGNGEIHIHSDTLSSESGSALRSSTDPLPSLPNDSQKYDKPRVRAVYSHEGAGDNQLAFVEDDIILLFGNKRDGWQYGQNARTKELGWFPISFTKALRKQNSFTKEPSSLGTSTMSKLSRSVADLTGGDTPKNNRSFLQVNTSLMDERSSMTLPYRKNNSSPASQLLRGSGNIPTQGSAPPSPPLPPPPASLSFSSDPSETSISPKTPASKFQQKAPSLPSSPPPPPPPNTGQTYPQGHPALLLSPPASMNIDNKSSSLTRLDKNSSPVPPPPPPLMSSIPQAPVPPPPPPMANNSNIPMPTMAPPPPPPPPPPKH